MGARFDINHANFVGYLTSDGAVEAPRTDTQTLGSFLMSLAYGGALISSTLGTPDDWTRKIAGAAERELGAMNFQWEENDILDANYVSRRLDPLRTYFVGYQFYAMVLPRGSWQEDRESFRFFNEAAVSSHANGLILMPEELHPHELTQVVDPFPAMRILAEYPTAPPAVVFWTMLGGSCVLPFAEAQRFFRTDLLPVLDDNANTADQAVRSVALSQRNKRILHLSDLHFGAPKSALRRPWLKEHLAHKLPTIDRVVVTGDLFDSPSEELRASFDEFRVDVENLTRKDLLVIPGNHDVRHNGIALGPIGRNSGYVTDLRWDPVVFDEELQAVFFSFNSSETGDIARGSVSERQRLDRAVLFDREVRKRPELSNLLKIALVHHHPYAYGAAPTALYERLLTKFFGSEEQFIAFEEAEAFLEWCASRGVSLILHGHKHVPHLTRANLVLHGRQQELTVVGCGSTTGVDQKPMCYDIITMNPDTKRWNVLFYHNERGDGSGFELQNVAIDLRSTSV